MGYEAKKDKSKKITKKAQNDFLKKINVKDWNEQSQILLGLALHTFQDYFAHVVRVSLYRTKNNYYPNKGYSDPKYYYQMCKVDDEKYMNLGNRVEDNPDVLPWRYSSAEGITYSIYKAWVNNKPIKYTYRISYSGSDLFYYKRTTGMFWWKKYWVIKSYKYYVTIKY